MGVPCFESWHGEVVLRPADPRPKPGDGGVRGGWGGTRDNRIVPVMCWAKRLTKGMGVHLTLLVTMLAWREEAGVQQVDICIGSRGRRVVVQVNGLCKVGESGSK